MDSPLTPGMSTMLDIAHETFEDPALGYATTPGAKDIYGADYAFSQNDWDAGTNFLNAFDSPGILSAKNDGVVEASLASAQTPALTTGPSAAANTSSSASQASPSVTADYFSRPRQPFSDGNSAHFVTAKPVESNNYSEFRKAINNRFNRARAANSTASTDLNHANPQAPPAAPTNDFSMDYSFTSFEAHQQPGQFRASDLDIRAEVVGGPVPTTTFDPPELHSQLESSLYLGLDPKLAGGKGPGAAEAQSASIPPPASQGPTTSGDTQLPPPPPIKRRRRRKAPPSAEVKAQKHKAFLERNREAASKCRTKKKSQIQQLEEDERAGRAINQMLKDEFRDVLGEVLLLREKVKLQDMACGGNCGSKCGAPDGERDEDEEKKANDADMGEDAPMDGDVESSVNNRDGIVETSGAQGTSGAGCDSGSDQASEDEDEGQDEDRDLVKNEEVKRRPK